jgi:hypothetical protein
VTEYRYPGWALGLPPEGAGSAAPTGRRFAALVVDLLYVGAIRDLAGERSSWVAFALALLDLVVLPWIAGVTIGKLLLDLRVVPAIDGVVLLDQRGLTLLSAIGRAFMWSCAPFGFFLALFRDRDGRTPWDRMARTVVVSG